jgi:hypothetical protein
MLNKLINGQNSSENRYFVQEQFILFMYNISVHNFMLQTLRMTKAKSTSRKATDEGKLKRKLISKTLTNPIYI